jgi:hypothetical protein
MYHNWSKKLSMESASFLKMAVNDFNIILVTHIPSKPLSICTMISKLEMLWRDMALNKADLPWWSGFKIYRGNNSSEGLSFL